MKKDLKEIKKYQDKHITDLNEEKLDAVIYDNLHDYDLLEDVLGTLEDSSEDVE